MPLARGAENRMRLSIKGVSKSQELLSCLLPPARRSGELFVASAHLTKAFNLNLCIRLASSQGLLYPWPCSFTAFSFSLGWSNSRRVVSG